MIKDKASEILKLLNNGSGIDKLKLEYPERELDEILKVITNECKSLISDKLESSKFEFTKYSDADDTNFHINTVTKLIKTFMSNENYIPGYLVSRVFESNGKVAPNVDLRFKKVTDSNGNNIIEIDELVSNRFYDEIYFDYNDLKTKLHEEVLNPYSTNLINSDEDLKKRHSITKLFSKITTKNKSMIEIKEDYHRILSDVYKNQGKDESKVKPAVDYVFSTIFDNPKFKSKIIESAKDGSIIEINGSPKNKSFNSFVENISAEIMDTIMNVDPCENMKYLNNIYSDMMAQITAMSSVFEKTDPESIQDKIKEINRLTNKTAGIDELYDENTGYRNIDVGVLSKSVEYIKKEDVQKAMDNLSLNIESLLKNSDEMSESEYIKEVARMKYRFIRIHPFPDGNGRTSRAITNMLLSEKNGIVEFDKYEKKGYLKLMNVIHEEVGKEHTSDTKYLENLVNDPDKCNELEDEVIDLLSDYISVTYINNRDIDTGNLSKEGKGEFYENNR